MSYKTHLTTNNKKINIFVSVNSSMNFHCTKKVQTNENREMLSILRFFFEHTEILSQTKKEAATYSCNQL